MDDEEDLNYTAIIDDHEDDINLDCGCRLYILILEQEIQMWRRLYLDQPEDRLYHASDATWWRRDDTQKVGQLRRAQIPEDLARKVRNLIEAAYIEGWREENRLLMDESCPPERRGAVMDINLSGDWEHSNAKLLSDRLYRPWSKD